MSNKFISVLVLLLIFSVSVVGICKMQKDSVAEILAKRYSGYKYDETKSVTQDQLLCILRAAQSAPSSYNDQPWNFIICDRATNEVAYNHALDGLVEFNQKWATKTPVLIICIASINSRKHEFNDWAQYDTGAAAFGVVLQATALGLMAHQMGGFDESKLKTSFNIPKNYKVMSVIAIGYAAAGEASARERKPLNENFFNGAWGQALY